MWHYLDAIKKNTRDEWLQELKARQQNVAIPDTVNNEVEMWRKLGEKPMTAVQKIGLGLLGVFVFGLLFFIIAFVTEGRDLHTRILSGLRFWASVVILGILIFGPLKALLAWSTKRALRNSRR